MSSATTPAPAVSLANSSAHSPVRKVNMVTPESMRDLHAKVVYYLTLELGCPSTFAYVKVFWGNSEQTVMLKVDPLCSKEILVWYEQFQQQLNGEGQFQGDGLLKDVHILLDTIPNPLVNH